MVFIPRWLDWFPLYIANLQNKKYQAAPTEFLKTQREKNRHFLKLICKFICKFNVKFWVFPTWKIKSYIQMVN